MTINVRARSESDSKRGQVFFYTSPWTKDRLFKLIRATQGTMEHERCRTRRVALQTNVRIKYGGEELEGGTVDVSLSGVLVRAARAFPRGSPVHVSLQLSNRIRPLAGAGAVVRVANGNQMGIQMDLLPVGERERLQEFLLPLIPSE